MKKLLMIIIVLLLVIISLLTFYNIFQVKSQQVTFSFPTDKEIAEKREQEGQEEFEIFQKYSLPPLFGSLNSLIHEFGEPVNSKGDEYIFNAPSFSTVTYCFNPVKNIKFDTKLQIQRDQSDAFSGFITGYKITNLKISKEEVISFGKQLLPENAIFYDSIENIESEAFFGGETLKSLYIYQITGGNDKEYIVKKVIDEKIIIEVGLDYYTPAYTLELGLYSIHEVQELTFKYEPELYSRITKDHHFGDHDETANMTNDDGFTTYVSYERDLLQLWSGNQFEEVKGLRLIDLFGDEVYLGNYFSENAILYYWATWCPPCNNDLMLLRDEMELLQGRGNDIVLINNEETAQAINDYLKGSGITYTVLIDHNDEFRSFFEIQLMPSTVYFNSEYHISRLIGGQLNETDVYSMLEK